VDTWRALGRHLPESRELAAFLFLMVGGPEWLDERSVDDIEEQLTRFADGLPPGADAQLSLFDHIDVRLDLARIAVPTLGIWREVVGAYFRH